MLKSVSRYTMFALGLLVLIANPVWAQDIDFSLEGSVKHVHQADDSYVTYLDIYVYNVTDGSLPTDIEDVVFEGPGGVIASLGDPGVTFEADGSSAGYFSYVIPSPPRTGNLHLYRHQHGGNRQCRESGQRHADGDP